MTPGPIDAPSGTGAGASWSAPYWPPIVPWGSSVRRRAPLQYRFGDAGHRLGSGRLVRL